ncbi:MAG: PAS domain-containing protein [Proteobacteria bacterium]|nr:PAS domain-containing protein [Pseudomonadota bacterium]
MSDDVADGKSLQKKIDGLLETLKQVNYQNEMMLNWVNGAVVMVDREGQVVQANNAALVALGWTLEEFIGRHMHETIHHSQDDGSEYPWDFCPVFAAIEDGSSHHVDGDVFWQKNGASFSADFIVCPTRDEKNEITGAVLTFRNLTEQRLKEANRIHSMKLESIGELSAGIAHEINTPIQFIGSNVSFLQDSFQDLLKLVAAYGKLSAALADSGQFAELLAEIKDLEQDADVEYLQDEAPKAFEQTQSGVDRVTKLILGLKGFAHSGDGESKNSCDINEIINNSLVVCHNAYKYVAEMVTDFGELPSLNAYPGDIGQVIINLVVNAAHAIADKKGESSEMGTIRISTSCQDKVITIAVSDTGGGIPEGVRQRVFDPFFTTKTVGRGSGQGLAISRTIIHDKHQGELFFESTIGRGTTFFIKLPL